MIVVASCLNWVPRCVFVYLCVFNMRKIFRESRTNSLGTRISRWVPASSGTDGSSTRSNNSTSLLFCYIFVHQLSADYLSSRNPDLREDQAEKKVAESRLCEDCELHAPFSSGEIRSKTVSDCWSVGGPCRHRNMLGTSSPHEQDTQFKIKLTTSSSYLQRRRIFIPITSPALVEEICVKN